MQSINPLLMLIEQQALRIDLLEGQVYDLEQALHLDKAANVQATFGLSETLAQLLILLSDGKPKNKDKLHAALYYRKPEVDAPDAKITDTLFCKLRKHIASHGVKIATVWGSGYQIVEGLQVVLSAMEFATLDVEEAARQRRLERARERQRRIRAAQGRVDRQTYLQKALSRQKPWESEGVSRATWYGRRRKTTKFASNDNAPVQGANQAEVAA